VNRAPSASGGEAASKDPGGHDSADHQEIDRDRGERRRPRHQPDQQETAGQQRTGLGPRDDARPSEQVGVENVLEQLGVDLDPGHPIGDRRGLIVRQTERRDADQHQLAFEQMRVDCPGENLRRRDEARGIGPREVHAHAAVGLGGNEQVAHAHRFDASGARPYGQQRLGGGDPEDLDAKRRDQRVTDCGDERHAPHHAALGVDAQKPVPLDDPIDLLGAVERGLEAAYARFRIGADDPERNPPDVAARHGRFHFQSRHPEHDRRGPERPRQDRVVARQTGKPLDQVVAHPGHELRQAAGREPIRLGHHDIDADGGGARVRDARYQLGEPGSRPRPLAV